MVIAPIVVTTYAGAVISAGAYVVDANATPLLSKVIVCPCTIAVVNTAFNPIVKVVPDMIAAVG